MPSATSTNRRKTIKYNKCPECGGKIIDMEWFDNAVTCSKCEWYLFKPSARVEPSRPWPRTILSKDIQESFKKVCRPEAYKGAPKKTQSEEIILALERYVSKVSPCDFFLETMEDVARLLGGKYLKEMEKMIKNKFSSCPICDGNLHDFGTSKNKVTIKMPNEWHTERNSRYFDVDSCMVPELKYLWDNEIITIECCCGHGFVDGYISVDDNSIGKMLLLGYENTSEKPERKDLFLPKFLLETALIEASEMNEENEKLKTILSNFMGHEFEADNIDLLSKGRWKP